MLPGTALSLKPLMRDLWIYLHCPKQIKLLENELGNRLLNRSTRSISLTEAGKEVLKQAESVRQTISDTHRIAESFHGNPKGLLRITSPTLFGKLYVQKAIQIFMDKYPEVDIQLDLSNKVLNILITTIAITGDSLLAVEL